MFPRILAFDCFGTIFDVSTLPKDEVRAYADHVRSQPSSSGFEEYEFPSPWYDIKPHEDSAIGINLLQVRGFNCVAFSNSSHELIQQLSLKAGIKWDYIFDPSRFMLYKPNIKAYECLFDLMCMKFPEENHYDDRSRMRGRIAVVTANPSFGDVKCALQCGMRPIVIRNGYPRDVIELAKMLQY